MKENDPGFWMLLRSRTTFAGVAKTWPTKSRNEGEAPSAVKRQRRTEFVALVKRFIQPDRVRRITRGGAEEKEQNGRNRRTLNI